MPGFSYGGFGDGTNWSSERGSGPEPGGGSRGNAGGSSSGKKSSPAQKQIDAIRADKNVRTKLLNLMMAARKINPSVRISVIRITPEGVMVLDLEGINATQAKQIGLTGLIMGISVPGYTGVIGDIETGHKYSLKNPEKHYFTEGGTSLQRVMEGSRIDNTPKIYRGWGSHDERNYYYFGKSMPMRLINHITVITDKDIEYYTVYFNEKHVLARYKIEVKNGDLNHMTVTPLSPGSPLCTPDIAKKAVREFASVKQEADKEVLLKASEVIISMGEKAGGYLGEKYKELSREIADNIKNFQGKRIRSYNDAMRSMNKMMANPGLKFSAADREAIVKAWQSFNADDMGNKFAALGKTFKVADYAMKAEKVRQKSIEGYRTGNWGPLMMEVESWVVSGIVSSVALGVFSATLGAALISLGAPAVVIGLMGIVIAGALGSFIDENLVDKLNNEIIRPTH
jgi:hypothetical protein